MSEPAASLTILIPEMRHPAIEERYAARQNELLLRRAAPGAEVRRYDASLPARAILREVTTALALVVTDPLVVTAAGLTGILATALTRIPDAAAAIPLSNESGNPFQRRQPFEPYLTLRQFENTASRIAAEAEAAIETEWDDADPGVYLGDVNALRTVDRPLVSALAGLPAVVVTNAYIHRFSSQRGQLRTDLLELIDPAARTILEFGCGEAALGSALKNRQACRVVGIELDPGSAAIARTRIDMVVSGDVQQIITTVSETFDCIIGGDILEHLDDPWTFLSNLRRVAAPGAQLVLSLPNIAGWPIIADLLQGRFDYVYMGITCAGHLRFFTRKTIEEMLEMTGWGVASITPQENFITPEWLELEGRLDAAGIAFSRADLATPGYYVVAVNG